MFSVLVSSHGLDWETTQAMSMHSSRFNEYGGNESERVSLDDPDSLTLLENAEAMLLYETIADGPHADVVRVGRLREVRAGKNQITFRFKETGRVPREVVVKYASLLEITPFEFERTHWSIKDGQIHHLVREQIKVTQERYDIALSFAGEDRTYVEKVAAYLQEHHVEVFYDKFEEVELWGKELSEHLDWVYRTGAQYCVMFISEHYAKKVWTNHERRSALAAAIEKRKEYILPVRFDSTELPGVRPTIGYLSLKDRPPEDLGAIILKKLGR